MIPIRSTLVRSVAAPLALLLVATSALPGLLEEPPPDRVLQLETEHDGRHCAPAHDHGLCLLVGTSRAWLPSAAPGLPAAESVVGLVFAATDRLHRPDASPQTRSRAPPTG